MNADVIIPVVLTIVSWGTGFWFGWQARSMKN